MFSYAIPETKKAEDYSSAFFIYLPCSERGARSPDLRVMNYFKKFTYPCLRGFPDACIPNRVPKRVQFCVHYCY